MVGVVLLEWLQWLQRSPHSQLLDVVWCSALVVAVAVAVVVVVVVLMLLKLQCCSCSCSCSRSCSVVEM